MQVNDTAKTCQACLRYNRANRSKAMTQFNRITFDPNIMGGRACIRGMRLTVSLILNLISNGLTAQDIVKEYPYLEEEDIRQSLQYAAWLADETIQVLEMNSS
jgi:uncharacterized protein (DUF433 family)